MTPNLGLPEVNIGQANPHIPINLALNILDSAAHFPVGSIFLTAGNTNPATFLGYGTWTLRASGQLLVGA